MRANPALSGLPLQVSRSALTIRCRRVDGPRAIRFLTFQRRGEREAYGVYGLHGEKRVMEVDLPLEGEPIDWTGVDAAGALARLFVFGGLDAARAGELVEQRAGDWLAEGLRVLLVIPLPFEQPLGALAPEPGWRALLVVVELPEHPGPGR